MKRLFLGTCALSLLVAAMAVSGGQKQATGDLEVESAKRNDVLPRQLSVKGTMQAVESFTPAMMAIDGNVAIYDAFLTTVSTHRVGNRPGRQEPRLKKCRPIWDRYLTVPRNQLHRRLASQAVAR